MNALYQEKKETEHKAVVLQCPFKLVGKCNSAKDFFTNTENYRKHLKSAHEKLVQSVIFAQRQYHKQFCSLSNSKPTLCIGSHETLGVCAEVLCNRL